MSDLISKKKLQEEMQKFCGNQHYLIPENVWDMVENFPEEENSVRPIKVKPIRVSNDRTDGCPICKREFYEKFNFCPDCGAKMDWGDKE